MKKFFKWNGLVLLVVVGLFDYTCVPEWWSWHQKVSVVVETRGGERWVSAVCRAVAVTNDIDILTSNVEWTA